MILNRHKIQDKIVFRVIFGLLILFNLKYFFLIAQIPFTLVFVDYMSQNEFYSEVTELRSSAKTVSDFYDEGKVGFVSDVNQADVFDLQESIKSFYIAQYALVPLILKNDTEENYVIGKFEKEPKTPACFSVYKKINEKIYIYKRTDK